MFGFLLRNKPILLSYWYVLIPDFGTSTSRFYDEVEEELTQRKVPNLETDRLEIPEGSALSARREYLSMKRERLLFEVCSTSFGTSWFFSCRFSEKPLRFRMADLLIVLAALVALWFAYDHAFGWLWGTGIYAASILGLIFLLKSVIPLGLYDLDTRLLRLPVIGPLYEVFLRAETYYREDTRVMYCDLVDQVVRAKVQEFAGQQNVKQIEFKQDETIPLRGGGFFGSLSRMIWAGLKSK